MAECSLSTKLKDSSSPTRNFSPTLALGFRWESIMNQWFRRSGRWAKADEAKARMLWLEREYADEVVAPSHG